MNESSFAKKIGETSFIFEKTILENQDIMFFITCDIPSERSFFMVRNISGEWEILYRAIVSEKILRMEKELAAVIEEMIAKD